MKLTLNNFCCWSNKTFEFPDSGLVLISGASGQGKSSIIRAIQFALYNQGGRKVETFGTKNCYVLCEFQDLIIKRSKGPCRLIVNNIEDDEAQNLINNKFTTFYLEQFQEGSFLLKTPMQRLEYIEHLSIPTTSTILKDKIKQATKTLNNLYIIQETELKILKQRCDEEQVALPSHFNIDLYVNIDPHVHQNLINSQKLLIEDLQTNLHIFEQLNNKLTYKQDSLNDIITEISHITIPREDLEQDIKNIKVELNNFKLIDQYKKEKQQLQHFEELLNSLNIDALNQEISEITATINQMSDIDNCINKLNLNNQILYSFKDYNLQQSNLENIQLIDIEPLKSEQLDLMEQIQSSACYECPSCLTPLKLDQNKLIIGKNICNDNHVELLKQKYKNKTKQIKIAEDTLVKWQYIQSQIENFKYKDLNEHDLVIENKNLTKYIQQFNSLKIKKDELIKTLEKHTNKQHEYKSNITIKLQEISKLKKICSKPIRSFDECNDEYNQLLSIQTLKHQHQNRLSLLNSNKQLLETEINSIVQQIKDVVKKIDNKNLSTEKNTLQNLENMYDEWKVYIQYTKYLSFGESLKQLLTQSQTTLLQLHTLKQFKLLIEQAEALSISSVLKRLNVIANSYLLEFFSDEPIVCKLVPYTENLKKQKKPSIGLEIDYKGYSLKELDTLSGGERDRIILAYTLAIADIQHASLVCLDECTSSLDVETANKVYKCLKDRASDRLYIVVAHQIVTGLFDIVEKV